MADRGMAARGMFSVREETSVAEEKEFRGVWWAAGADCGEERHRLVVVDERGDRRQSMWIKNRIDEIEKGLVDIVTGLPDGAHLRVISEGVRSLGSVLSVVAMRLGIEQWEVNPKALSRYREVEGQPRKDDDTDGWLLARMCVVGASGCHRVVDPRPEERRLARLSRLHGQLKSKRTAAQSQLRSRLVELAPEVVSTEWQGPAASGKGMLAVLQRWPAFIGLESAHLATIERLVRSSTRYGEKCTAMAQALKAMARRVRMAAAEREVVRLEMRLLVDELSAFEVSCAEVEREIKTAVLQHPVARKLLAMPGVGHLTAAADVGEILPLARNVSEGKAATYAGLTPLSRSSGKSEGRSRLARGVNKHALDANYLSALAALKSSALDAAYYRKQRELHQGHPKPHVAALLSLARQRFKVKYTLMTTDAVYDKEVLIASHLHRLEQARHQKT
jgi:transposase